MEEEQQRHEVCAVEKVPGLYLTDWVGASSVNEVNILNITHILTILSAVELDQYGPEESEGVMLRNLDITDSPSTNMIRYFGQECDWLDMVLETGVVLVHCQQGISRSATIVVAYVMRRLQTSFDDALAMVKRSRGIININKGFQEQLRVWEQCRYDIFDDSVDGRKKGRKKPAYVAWKKRRRQEINSNVGPSANDGPQSATSSPKTPVREVGVQGWIDYIDSEMA